MTEKELQKYKQRSVQWLLKNTQEYFNRFIRLRDSDNGVFTCISCGVCNRTVRSDGYMLMNAGHYKSVGGNSCLRFHEDNVHGQCSICNTHLHGNLLMYKEGIIKKIGQDRLDALDECILIANTSRFKWDKIILIETLIKYQRLCGGL